MHVQGMSQSEAFLFLVRENHCLKRTRSEGDFVSDFSNFPIFAEKGHDLRSKRVLFENCVKPAATMQ